MCALNLSTCHPCIALVFVVDLVFFTAVFCFANAFQGFGFEFFVLRFLLSRHGFRFALCIDVGDGRKDGRRNEWEIC